MLGKTVQHSQGGCLLLQHRPAVLNPQLVGTFQCLLAGVIEYLCKTKLGVSWVSREASPACS